VSAPGFPDDYLVGPDRPPKRPGHSRIDRRRFLQGGLGLGAAIAGGVTAWVLTPRSDRTAQAGSSLTRSATSSTTGYRASRADGLTVPPTTPQTAPSMTSPSTTVPPPGPLPFHYFGPSDDRRVYLTIDDGWFPNRRVLEIMRAEHIPVTTFLVVDAAKEHRRFWKAFVDAGGRIENHTVSHPYLTRMTAGHAEAEWAGAQRAFASWYGRRPTLGRPPYGALNRAVSVAAANAGLSTLLGWSAVDTTGTVQTYDDAPLTAGQIALSHWIPGVETDFESLLTAADHAHLTPSYLPDHWPAAPAHRRAAQRSGDK
jgi:peptidoglycan/xylan/chitin deacetylase (PgdA/CDA1 family)